LAYLGYCVGVPIMSTTRKLYPSDVTDAEWEFLMPYLNWMREDAPQRQYPSREWFNASAGKGDITDCSPAFEVGRDRAT
jgi:hypothetical protein